MRSIVGRCVLCVGWLSALPALSSLGCAMPPGMNDRCDWPSPAAISDAPRDAERRALLDDIRIAEELAIRFTDAQGKLSPLAGQRLRDCEARLFAIVASNRGVPVAEVLDARTQLSAWRWDLPVHVPLMALIVAAVVVTARRIRHRFSSDDWIPVTFVTLAASIALGLATIALGHLSHGAVEMIRVGNTHMSYPAFRLGWQQHSGVVFVLVVVTCWIGVVASYISHDASTRSPT